MNTILTAEFEKIYHKMYFQPQTEPTGKALDEANHIIRVEELRKNGKSYLIRAESITQTSVTSLCCETSCEF